VKNITAYRAAIPMLRKFAPDIFSAGAGYDLRHIKTADDLTRAQKAAITRYYNFIAPLMTVDNVPRKKAPKKARALYSELYGAKKIPAGIVRVPVPRAAEKIKNETVDGEKYAVVYRDGTKILRYVFNVEESAAIADGDGELIAKDIFSRFSPDAASMVTGTGAAIRTEGIPNLYYNEDMLGRALANLAERYGNTGEWLGGLDIYFFRGDDRGSAFKASEKKRYTERQEKKKALSNAHAVIKEASERKAALIESTGRLLRHIKNEKTKQETRAGLDKEVSALNKKIETKLVIIDAIKTGKTWQSKKGKRKS
jgi:hypothetical protein